MPLRLAAGGAGANVSLTTGAVILAGAAGSTAPRAQQVTQFNPGTASVHFGAAPFTSSGETWLGVSPAAGVHTTSALRPRAANACSSGNATYLSGSAGPQSERFLPTGHRAWQHELSAGSGFV